VDHPEPHAHLVVSVRSDVRGNLGADLTDQGLANAVNWCVDARQTAGRHAEIYPEPFVFRPERFVGVTRGTYTWLPFGGGGGRRCPADASIALQEMKIVLRAVVDRLDLAPVGDPEKTTRRSITVSPSRDCEVRLSTHRGWRHGRARQRTRRAHAGRGVAGL